MVIKFLLPKSQVILFKFLKTTNLMSSQSFTSEIVFDFTPFIKHSKLLHIRFTSFDRNAYEDTDRTLHF